MIDNKPEFFDKPSSYWLDSIPAADYPRLQEDIKVDVAVVGGGIAGITAAFLLKKQGLKIAVIEADRILQGTTGHTTAKITSQHALIYARIKKEMGEELARQYAEANESAIHMIASLIKQHDIDCDFSWRPAYLYTNDHKYIKDIEDEGRAASAFGIKAFCDSRVPLPMPVKAVLRFEGQAQFHPLKYLLHLAQTIPGQGSAIYENTAAINIEADARIITREGPRITAHKIIIASHFPFFDGGGLYFSRLHTERSYVIGVKLYEKFPPGMFINAESPTRSLRSQPDEDGEIVLIGGENHKTGDGDKLNKNYQNLLDFAHENYEVRDVLYRWSAQDCITLDGVPYVGNLTARHANLYVAAGFGKWGMTNATAAAMILSDLIIDGDNPWAPVYNPSRFNLASLKSLTVENLDAAKEYITGKLAALPKEVEILNGEAKAVEIDGQRVGAYRDNQGELHMVDITCTHLGCELKWNDAETCWDCPCHGSRFSVDGDIIEGPAFYHLNQAGENNHVEARIFK